MNQISGITIEDIMRKDRCSLWFWNNLLPSGINHYLGENWGEINCLILI